MFDGGIDRLDQRRVRSGLRSEQLVAEVERLLDLVGRRSGLSI